MTVGSWVPSERGCWTRSQPLTVLGLIIGICPGTCRWRPSASRVWQIVKRTCYPEHGPPADNTLFSAAAARARGLAAADGFVQIGCERRRTCLRRASPGSGTSLTAETLAETSCAQRMRHSTRHRAGHRVGQINTYLRVAMSLATVW
jgi:hypothetical protein